MFFFFIKSMFFHYKFSSRPNLNFWRLQIAQNRSLLTKNCPFANFHQQRCISGSHAPFPRRGIPHPPECDPWPRPSLPGTLEPLFWHLPVTSATRKGVSQSLGNVRHFVTSGSRNELMLPPYDGGRHPPLPRGRQPHPGWDKSACRIPLFAVKKYLEDYITNHLSVK